MYLRTFYKDSMFLTEKSLDHYHVVLNFLQNWAPLELHVLCDQGKQNRRKRDLIEHVTHSPVLHVLMSYFKCEKQTALCTLTAIASS